jgi:hypothetical protein
MNAPGRKAGAFILIGRLVVIAIIANAFRGHPGSDNSLGADSRQGVGGKKAAALHLKEHEKCNVTRQIQRKKPAGAT